MKRRVTVFILCIVVVFIVLIVVYLCLQTPRADREWISYLSRTSTTEETENGVRITNVLDWDYNIGSVSEEKWIDEIVIDPKNIVSVWFIVEPFYAYDLVGHTYLSFELEDGSAYAFSIEARREVGEGYSSRRGLFNQYELAYIWGTERDFVTRRALMLEHPQRMYRLAVSRDDAAAIFKTFADATNELANKPRFYNTLTSNCTNELAHSINDRYPNSIPYSITWNLPGNSDIFLLRKGFIEKTGTIEEMRKKAELIQHQEMIHTIAQLTPKEFSEELRQLFVQ